MSFINNVTKAIGQIGTVVKKTYGPLAALEGNPVGGDVYRYPLEVGDSRLYPHTVEFQTWIPKPEVISTAVSEGAEKFIQKILHPGKEGILPGEQQEIDLGIRLPQITAGGRVVDDMRVNRNQQFNSRLFDFTRRAEPSDLIVLYLPPGGWNDQVQNQYNEVSVTEALGNLGLVAEAGSAFTKAYQSADGDFLTKFMAGLQAASNSPAGGEFLGKSIGGLLQQVGIVGDAGTLTNIGIQSLGYATNPQYEVLYGGTQMREFQFDFTMTPRSQKEAKEIMQIVQRLKYHASPQFTDNQGRYIIPPSYFDITFKFNGNRNKNLPKISTCALRAVDINYSGGLEQWATFEDGMPIQIQLVLRFVELEMMHKALRDRGY